MQRINKAFKNKVPVSRKYKNITSDDIFVLPDISLNNKVMGLTKKHIINCVN